MACAHGWWPRGCQKDQEVSVSTFHGHRGEMKKGSSVWGRGPAPGGLSCRKGSPGPNKIPQEIPSQAQGSGNLQIISGQRGGGLNTRGSESQGPLTRGGPAFLSCPLRAPGQGNAGQARWRPSCDSGPRSLPWKPGPSVPRAAGSCCQTLLRSGSRGCAQTHSGDGQLHLGSQKGWSVSPQPRPRWPYSRTG